MNTYREPSHSKRYRPPTEITDFLGNNSPRFLVKIYRAPGCQIIRSQPLQEWYTHRGRQCVCDFSGFSKGIPSLEHPRVVCTLPTGYHCRYTVGWSMSCHGGKRCSLSSSYLAHIDRLTSARNCVTLWVHNRLVVHFLYSRVSRCCIVNRGSATSSFQGAQRRE